MPYSGYCLAICGIRVLPGPVFQATLSLSEATHSLWTLKWTVKTFFVILKRYTGERGAN